MRSALAPVLACRAGRSRMLGCCSCAVALAACGPEVTTVGDAGSIAAVVYTWGQNLDPDGYVLTLDDTLHRPVGIRDTTVFAQVSPGDHRLTLTGLVGTCYPVEQYPLRVAVPGGDTTGLFLQVTCMGMPDYVKIVFTRGNWPREIYGMAADGADAVNLTNHPRDDRQPAWSPDGLRLAFISARHGDEFDIYVVNADGTGLTRLTHRAGDEERPAWSPDGSMIAFSAAGSIYRMLADGVDVVNLTAQSGMADCCPAWSPDGSKIAFERFADTTSAIWVMNPDGSEQSQLTPQELFGRQADREPAWSPDGGKIVFRSLRNPVVGFGYELFTVNADGTGLSKVADLQGHQLNPAWTADGRILFASGHEGAGAIYIINDDGSGLTRLSGAGANDNFPRWRPPS